MTQTPTTPATPWCRQNALKSAWAEARRWHRTFYVFREGDKFFIAERPVAFDEVRAGMAEFTAVTPEGTTRGYTPE